MYRDFIKYLRRILRSKTITYFYFTKTEICRELRDNLDKYLKNPGTLAISKALHDIYKHLNIESLKEAEEAFLASKSDQNLESEPENSNSYIREHITRIDNHPFDFQPINPNAVGCCIIQATTEHRSFMEMFKSSFINKPTESVTLSKKGFYYRTREEGESKY